MRSELTVTDIFVIAIFFALHLKVKTQFFRLLICITVNSFELKYAEECKIGILWNVTFAVKTNLISWHMVFSTHNTISSIFPECSLTKNGLKTLWHTWLTNNHVSSCFFTAKVV